MISTKASIMKPGCFLYCSLKRTNTILAMKGEGGRERIVMYSMAIHLAMQCYTQYLFIVIKV